MKSKWVNKVNIQGYVYDKGEGRRELQKRVTGENSKNPGQEYIQGELNIATDDNATNVVTVWFQYVAPTYPARGDKPERPNPTFQTLETIINNATTFKEVGKAATTVRIDANIGLNDWYNNDGELVSNKRIEGSFAHLMNSAEKIADRAATFEADMVISSAAEREMENEEDNYVNLNGYVFNFRNDVLPITLTIRNEAGMKYFLDQDYPMVTKVWGDIVSNIVKVEHVTESAFGAPTVDVTTRSIRAWDVIGASAEPMDWDDESTITRDELKEKVRERETRLAEQKKRDEEYRNRAASAFTSTSTSAVVEEDDDDDDDFPF